VYDQAESFSRWEMSNFGVDHIMVSQDQHVSCVFDQN
jgi:hypothetical protein